jgi:hypothetical protein
LNFKLKTLVLALVLFLISSTSVIAQPNINFSTSNVNVSRVESDKIVKIGINKFGFLTNMDNIELVEPLYDIDNKQIAYYYSFKGIDQNYYFIIAANKNYSPILAAGEGNLSIPDLDNGEKYYFINANNIVKAKSGQSITDAIEKKTKTKININDYKIKQNPNAKKIFDSYSSLDTNVVSPLSAYQQRILSINSFSQWDPNVDSGIQSSACGQELQQKF